MKKQQFAVLGMGRFGRAIVKTLGENGYEVLCADKNMSSLNEVSQYATDTVQLDMTDEIALKKINLGDFDCVIIASGDSLESSVMATVFAKRMGVKRVIAKARTENESDVLKMVGADKVVMPERDMGARLANTLVSSTVLDYINFSDDVAIVEVEAIDAWVGKNLRQINFRAKYGVNVVAIKNGNNYDVSPSADMAIKKTDILVIIGKKKDLEKVNQG